MTSADENPDAPADGAGLPRATAHPVAEPVLIQLVPFGLDPHLTADHAATSAFVVASGFHRLADPEIHRLSKIVLQLAMTNFALSFFLELIRLVGAMFSSRYVAILYFIFWVSFAYYVMWLGIRGVKTRNGHCCSCCSRAAENAACAWGYLDAFRWIYVFLALARAALTLVAMVFFAATELVFNVLLLILLSATAEYARKLLLVIKRDDRGEGPTGVAPARATVDNVPMATAQAVEPADATLAAAEEGRGLDGTSSRDSPSPVAATLAASGTAAGASPEENAA